MIKVKDGSVHVAGTPIDILTDISVMAHCVKGNLMRRGIPSKEAGEMIASAVKIGLMSEDELDREKDRLLKEMIIKITRMGRGL